MNLPVQLLLLRIPVSLSTYFPIFLLYWLIICLSISFSFIFYVCVTFFSVYIQISSVCFHVLNYTCLYVSVAYKSSFSPTFKSVQSFVYLFFVWLFFVCCYWFCYVYLSLVCMSVFPSIFLTFGVSVCQPSYMASCLPVSLSSCKRCKLHWRTFNNLVLPCLLF